MLLFSKSSTVCFGYFDPEYFFCITKIIKNRGELTDISAAKESLPSVPWGSLIAHQQPVWKVFVVFVGFVVILSTLMSMLVSMLMSGAVQSEVASSASFLKIK